jgi:hypothetical protein
MKQGNKKNQFNPVLFDLPAVKVIKCSYQNGYQIKNSTTLILIAIIPNNRTCKAIV